MKIEADEDQWNQEISQCIVSDCEVENWNLLLDFWGLPENEDRVIESENDPCSQKLTISLLVSKNSINCSFLAKNSELIPGHAC